MISSNIATVFAPNLLRPKNEDITETVLDTNNVAAIMHSMIDDFEFLFKVFFFFFLSPLL